MPSMQIAWLVVALGGLASGLGACKSTSTVAKEDMQLVPKDSDIVLMANLNRMRNTAMWRKMLDLRDSDAQSKKDYDDFVKRCALDPLKQIDSIFLAFPQSAGEAKEFAVVLRGQFNEDRLVSCAREQTKKDGSDVATSEYAGRKLYTDTKQGQAFVAFLDGKTIVLGGKEWIKKVLDLAARKDGGPSAADRPELVALVKRAKISDAIWGAGVVPQSVRDGLKNDPNLSAAASIRDIFGSLDFAAGLAIDLNVDLGSETDAKDMVLKVQSQVADTKKNGQVMAMGIASLLDQVKIDAKGPTFHVAASFNQPQVDDIVTRVKGLLKAFGGAFGGMNLPSQSGVPTPAPAP